METCEKCGKKLNPLNIFFILDGSGSMYSVQDDVVGGLNAFVEEQKKNDPNDPFTLTVFDTSVKEKIVAQPVGKIKKFTQADTYLGGNTALLDAVGKTLTEVKGKKLEGKKLVVIYTDGHENSSKEWTNESVKKLIQKLEKKGDWTVTFLSADVDNFDQAYKIGIHAGNYLNTSSAATGSTMSSLGSATAAYKSSPVHTTSTFIADTHLVDLIEEEEQKKKKLWTPGTEFSAEVDKTT